MNVYLDFLILSPFHEDDLVYHARDQYEEDNASILLELLWWKVRTSKNASKTFEFLDKTLEKYRTKSPLRAGVPEYWMLMSSPLSAHTAFPNIIHPMQHAAHVFLNLRVNQLNQISMEPMIYNVLIINFGWWFIKRISQNGQVQATYSIWIFCQNQAASQASPTVQANPSSSVAPPEISVQAKSAETTTIGWFWASTIILSFSPIFMPKNCNT